MSENKCYQLQEKLFKTKNGGEGSDKKEMKNLFNDFPDDLKEKIRENCEKRDSNLNDFPSSSLYDTENMEEIWGKLQKYEEYIEGKPAYNNDSQLLDEISTNIKYIKTAWNYYQEGEVEKATEEINNILKKYINDSFFVTELKNCYGTKQIAGYDELKGTQYDYEKMERHKITLYRGRVSNEFLKDRKQLLHRPYKKNETIHRQRFTCEGMPALYLATTSYTCWLELNKPEKDFYVSLFVPDEKGEKLHILNLVITQEIISGIYNCDIDCDDSRQKELRDKMLAFYPLVIATSYKKMKKCEDKKEYIIPELVMRSLKKYGIDGVAYISKKLEHDLSMPIGINIAIPIYKEKLNQGYGEVSKFFRISEPGLYSKNDLEKDTTSISGSYFCDIFCANEDENKWAIELKDDIQRYKDLQFAKLDNYLTTKELKYYDE